ncbi:MAG TPA: hypothetical protein VF234_07420, partial [Limnochordia bacterium]
WFDVRPSDGIPGYDTIDNKHPFALIFFNERLQALHKRWLDALLTTPNPYTGQPLAKEPAIALIELVNEDSFFFWTFSKRQIPAQQWEELEQRFGAWLADRYGSVEAAIAAWGGPSLPSDDPAQGQAGLYEAWYMTRDGLPQVNRRRISDQVRFLAELQRRFYAETVRYVREELGASSLIVASNWTVADPLLLDPIERYTYTAADVVDRHGYVQGKHEGEGASYSVRIGHTYEDLAAVTVPASLPLAVIQVEGYPHIISELGWPSPNRYRADALILSAAYAGLQGLDGLFFFAVGNNFLNDQSISKFSLSTPLMAGGFPAAALLYRRGDVTSPPPVIRQAVGLEQLYALRGAGGATAQALDAARLGEAPLGSAGAEGGGIDPLAPYVGPVVRAYTGSGSSAEPLEGAIDRQARVIRSRTGELVWRWGDGIVTIDTPRSQGAAGFLGKAGRIELTDVTLEVQNPFASVVVTALDDLPLSRSKKILVQALTEDQPYGFRVDQGRIVALGGPPFEVRRIDAAVELRVAGPIRVVALDENGYARPDPVAVTAESGGGVRIQLRPDALYHVILR